MPNDEPKAQLNATAFGWARIYQAAGDQHFTYIDGARNRPAADPADGPAICPYPGLEAFEASFRGWFHGREGTTAALLARLDRRLRNGGLQFVVGPSGVGKSSVLKAGLLGQLAAGRLTGSSTWRTAVCTPSAGLPAEEAEVLIVDQFEELFTAFKEPREQQDFVDAVTSRVRPGRVIVLGLRADFYHRCLGYEPLRAALQDDPLVIGPMSRDELTDAIELPARDVGLRLEEGLVELLLTDLGLLAGGYEAGRLPLLAHALRTTWQQRSGDLLTVQAYRNSGGIQGAIAASAEAVHLALEPADQEIAQNVFRRLVRIGDTADDTRRRVPLSDLLELGDPERVDAVVARFVTARLISPDDDSVRITHEALLHSWPRLRRWINDDRETLLAGQNVEDRAAQWVAADRDPALLDRGKPLAVALAWAEAGRGATSTAREFAGRSRRQAGRAARVRKGVVAVLVLLLVVAGGGATLAWRQQREAVAQRDLARVRRAAAEAERLREVDNSVSAQLALTAYGMPKADGLSYSRLVSAGASDLATPVRLGEEATSIAFTPDAQTMVTASALTTQLWNISHPERPVRRTAIAASPGEIVWVVATSKKAPLLATGDTGGTVTLHDLTDPDRPRRVGAPRKIHTDGLWGLAFSPDGKMLASAGDDSIVRLWKVTSGGLQDIGRLPGNFEPTRSLSFRAGGVLATAGDDKKVRIWKLGAGRPKLLGKPLTGYQQGLWAVAFSGDGKTLATAGGDPGIRLWDTSDPARPKALGQPLTGHTNIIKALSFSPDQALLASAGDDRTVRLWNVTSPRHARPVGTPLVGQASSVMTAVYSPTGAVLATGGEDFTVHLWRRRHSPLLGHVNAVQALAIQQDNKFLVSAGQDGTIRVWDQSGTSGQRILVGSGRSVLGLAISPTDEIIAGGGPDGTVRLWRLTGKPEQKPLGKPLTGHGGYVWSVAFSPDGDTLASTSYDGNLRLWDVSDPARAKLITKIDAGDDNDLQVVRFSHDGRTLATADDTTVRLWNVTDPRHPALTGVPLLGHENKVTSLDFSPDDRYLASGSLDTFVSLWNVANPAQPGPRVKIGGHTAAVWSVSFSPDGRTLASSGYDGDFRLWSVADPAHLATYGQPRTGHIGPVFAAIFDSVGDSVLTAGLDGTVRETLLSTKTIAEWICQVSAPAMTPEVWNNNIGPDVTYHPPCH